MNSKELIDIILDGINAGTWEWDIASGEEKWSDQFYQVLGYEPGEIKATYATFIDFLVAPDQKEFVSQKVAAHLEKREKYDVEILMRTKSDGFRWFRSIGNARFTDSGPNYMVGTIVDIHKTKTLQLEREHLQMLLEEVGDMAKIGAWEISIGDAAPTWSDEVYRIHEVEPGKSVGLAEAFDFFEKESQQRLQEAYQKTLDENIPYDLNLQLITAKGNQRWVRSICRPLTNKDGKLIKLRGSFQDITKEVEQAVNSQKKQNLLAEQNNRLLNFAHIISHNLRSHSGNLQLMSGLLEDETFDKEEEKELISNISKISADLSSTIHHLNEVVKVQTKVEHIQELLHFHDQIESVKAALYLNIKRSNAEIFEDFQIPSIQYVPAYLESIFLNMISNALKYADPERSPLIQIKSFKDSKGKINLHFKDNGLGIDLKRHQSKIFGLYKTFHKHEDSRGVGLFLTKNQVESLGGSIDIESEVGKGTTFKFKF